MSTAADQPSKLPTDQKPRPVDISNLPPLLPLPDAARLLGIPRASAYRYAQAGTLPVKRFGRRIYVVTAKLRDVFESESHQPTGQDAA